MSDPSLSRIDLNLLVALDALLRERSVTRAAALLGLSQPSLSASLARLRNHFGDLLLVRDGNTSHLTPLAIMLSEQTGVALDTARRVFSASGAWDPARSDREFVIYGSDYAFATVGQRITELAAEQAPDVRFRFVLHSPEFAQNAHDRLRTADGLIFPHGFLTDLPHVDLWSDHWAVLASSDNEDVGDELTLAQAAESPWVFTYGSRGAFTIAAQQMQQLGVTPRIDCIVEGFLSMPFFIAGTRRLGLIQGRLAPYALHHPGIRVLPCPFDATPILDSLWWHPSYTPDAGHRWMRELVHTAAAELR